MGELSLEAILSRYQAAQSRRRPWESLWRDCYAFALPQRGSGFGSEFDPANLTPNESTPARNATPISDTCGVVSIIAIGGGAHFRQGDATVVATTTDPFLPAGIWYELPVFEGGDTSHISFIATSGAGSIVTQICERQ